MSDQDTGGDGFLEIRRKDPRPDGAPAVATYWVDNVTGDDGNAGGPDHSDAKATLSAAIALLTTKGDILNVVNTGTPYQISGTTTLPTGQSGTSFSDPSVTIRGTDSSGSASMPEMRWTDDGTSEGFLRISTNSAYCIVQGLHFNWAALTATPNAKSVITRLTASASVRLQYCYFQGAQDKGGAIFKDNGSFTTDGGEVRYNYFLNPHEGVQCLAPHGLSQWSCYNNVLVVNEVGNTGPAWCDLDNQDLDSTDHRIYNNTVVVYSTADVYNGPIVQSNENVVVSGTPTKHFHSNVIANFGGTAFGVMEGNAGAGEQAEYSQLIGYNIFVDPSSHGWGTNGPYEQPFDPGDAASIDVYGTDVETVDDPFSDKDAAWSWDFEGSSYSVTLPGDFRLTTYHTASQSGGVPGAISETVVPENPPSPPSPPPIWTGDPGNISELQPGKLLVRAALELWRNSVLLQVYDELDTDPDIPIRVTQVVPVRYYIPPSTTQTLTLGQLSPATYVLLTVDQPVTLTVNGEDLTLNADAVFFIAAGQINSLSVTNSSTVHYVSVDYLASDG